MAPATTMGTYRCSNCANQIEVVRTALPLCPNCTLAESFRQRFPDRVTDKAPRPGVSLPPQ